MLYHSNLIYQIATDLKMLVEAGVNKRFRMGEQLGYLSLHDDEVKLTCRCAMFLQTECPAVPEPNMFERRHEWSPIRMAS